MSFKWFKKHTQDGLETPDPTPIEVPLGLQRPLTLQEQIKRFTESSAIQAELAQKGFETFEESEDFGPENPEVDLPFSPHELQEDDDLPVNAKIDEVRSGMVQPFEAKGVHSHKQRVDAQAKAQTEAKNEAI